MEIEIGEYVRTRQGYIAKLIETDEEDEEYMQFDGPIRIDWGDEVDYISSKEDVQKITKHFKNIIDLIEVGDYVNGYRVTDIMSGYVYLDKINAKTRKVKTLVDYQIETILTHEQYENNCYKVVK